MTGVDTVFAGCAILGAALFVLRLALFLVGHHADAGTGLDHDFDAHFDVDHDLDAAAGADAAVHDSEASFRLLSFQGVTAFFMMFGLVGLSLRKEAMQSEAVAVLGGLVVGAFAFWLMGKIMVFMRSLQSSGTLRMANAIGQEGTVYLTIPAGGVGKVQVVVQGRLMVFNAVTDGGKKLQTGDRITVKEVAPDNMLVVNKL
jgi:hypothetical protein